jgi:hypothetical protein
MDITITYLGNSATLANLLSVKVIRDTTQIALMGVFAEDDLPPEWQGWIRRPAPTTAVIQFPTDEYLVEIAGAEFVYDAEPIIVNEAPAAIELLPETPVVVEAPTTPAE